MFKKRNAQGLSITTIIIAVIGLVIVIVLIAIFSGRLGKFGQGLDEAKTCDSLCTSQNLDPETKKPRDECTGRVMAGSFGDVSGSTPVIPEVPEDTSTIATEFVAEIPSKPFVCCCTTP